MQSPRLYRQLLSVATVEDPVTQTVKVIRHTIPLGDTWYPLCRAGGYIPTISPLSANSYRRMGAVGVKDGNLSYLGRGSAILRFMTSLLQEGPQYYPLLNTTAQQFGPLIKQLRVFRNC